MTGHAGRLSARPGGQVKGSQPTGLQPLTFDGERAGWVYVPATYRPAQQMPLVLALHGAGGASEQAIRLFEGLAEELGVIVVAPDSRRQTWDVIVHSYGQDVAVIERALREMFSHYAVTPERVGVSGFSDGASYALSLGLTNGDLFTHILAFSPGFSAPAARVGEPLIYVSHGTHDQVLPVDSCSRRLVPALERAGYHVRYHEFDGAHTVPVEIAREALEWFTA